MAQAWIPSPTDTYLNLSNGQIRFEYTKGKNIPLVFIHGLSYPMEVWSPLVNCAQGAEHSTICYDLYGRGQSSYDGSALSTELLAQQVVEILDRLQISTPVQVIALSNSDLIALQLAIAHPKRVNSVCLIAPSGCDERTMNPYLRWGLQHPVLRDVIGWYLHRQLYNRMNTHYRHLPSDSPEFIKTIYHFAKTTVQRNPFFRDAICSQIAYQLLPSQLPDLVESFAQTSIPVQLLHFEEEFDSTSRGVEVFSKLASTHTVRHLPGTHMGLLEHPLVVWTEIRNRMFST